MVEGDCGGCQVLSIQQSPTCLELLQNPMIIEEHQHIHSGSLHCQVEHHMRDKFATLYYMA